jgi:hypothetical protein
MVNYSAVFLVASIILGQAVRGAELDDFAKLHQFHGSWEATDVASQGQTHSAFPFRGNRFSRVSLSSTVGKPSLIMAMKRHSEGSCSLDVIPRITACAAGALKTAEISWSWNSPGGMAPYEPLGHDNHQPGRRGRESPSPTVSNCWTRTATRGCSPYADGEKSEAVFQRVTGGGTAVARSRSLEAPEDLDEPLSDIAWWAGNFSMERIGRFHRARRWSAILLERLGARWEIPAIRSSGSVDQRPGTGSVPRDRGNRTQPLARRQAGRLTVRVGSASSRFPRRDRTLWARADFHRCGTFSSSRDEWPRRSMVSNIERRATCQTARRRTYHSVLKKRDLSVESIPIHVKGRKRMRAITTFVVVLTSMVFSTAFADEGIPDSIRNDFEYSWDNLSITPCI